MGLFAAALTYLVAAALLVGGAVAGLSVLFAPSETLNARSPPPLIRAAERKSPPPPKAEAPSQARIVTPPIAGPSPVIAPASPPAGSQLQSASPQRQSSSSTAPVTAQAAPAPTNPAPAPPAKKKKIVKKQSPALQREADTTTLGYGPERRRFVFPFDPGW